MLAVLLAMSISNRIKTHKEALRSDRHVNSHLQRAWNKYGEQAFTDSILELCHPEDCLIMEQYWMDLYQVCNQEFGYNLAPRAGSLLGIKHPKEFGEEVSKRKTGVKWSENNKKKLSDAHKERLKDPVVKAKFESDLNSPTGVAKRAAKRRGVPRDAETKQKLSASVKEHFASMTPEEKKLFRERCSEGCRKYQEKKRLERAAYLESDIESGLRRASKLFPELEEGV